MTAPILSIKDVTKSFGKVKASDFPELALGSC